jgi:hypothetical protein
MLHDEAISGGVAMTIGEIYRTASITPRSRRRIRSFLARSTLLLGSFAGYWVLIAYVLP